MKYGIRIALILAIVLIVSLAFATVISYNGLVRDEIAVDREYAKIDNRLTERQATITQLLSVVEGLAAYEASIIDAITSARAAYAAAQASGDLEGMIEADALYVESLTSLLVVVENYPDIASDAAFLNLMVTISGIESALFVARNDYNNAVADYNESVRMFPRVIIANMFDFAPSIEYWQLADGAGEIPAIDFGTYDNPQA